MDRGQLGPAIYQRERLVSELHRALGPRDLICLPTAPTIAQLKGAASHDRRGDFYSRTLSLTSIAGVGRLPQISMPLASVSGIPAGLSLIGPHNEDIWLMQVAQRFA
jgi:amidase